MTIGSTDRAADDAGARARVTAIVPVKSGREPFLGAALRSLTSQRCPRWLAIVATEPGEEAAIGAVLSDLGDDPRIRVVANLGRGLPGAINTALRAAVTGFAALLLGDDEWAPDAVGVLEREIDAHPAIDFFHSARRIIDALGAAVGGPHPVRRSFAIHDFRSGSPVKHLLCFRRELALSVGGIDERCSPCVGPDDYDFPWTMAENGARFHPIEECLYLYRDHRSAPRLTTHEPLSVHTRGIVRILRKHGVGWMDVFRLVRSARRGYLRQCLFRTKLHAWAHRTLGVPTRPVWHEVTE